MTDYKEAFTARELGEALSDLRKMIGDRYIVNISFSTSAENPATVSINYSSTCSRVHEARGKSIGEALAKAASWAETSVSERLQKRIKDMALAIISITHDCEQCTVAALQAHGFTRAAVETHHLAACAVASAMCANAPFAVEGVAAVKVTT